MFLCKVRFRGIGLLLGLLACQGGAETKSADPSAGEAAVPPSSLEPQTSSRSSWATFREKHLPQLKGTRWAVLLHRPTYTLVDSLQEAGAQIALIYAPEHGLFGQKIAGQTVADTTYHGLRVISLYGRRKAPTPQELSQVDAILFALRDVGVRHYTYLSTLAYVLQAAAEAKRPVWLLDFPNPHAHYAYGPLLDSSLFSFVGLYPTPLVPGLTIGEHAQLLVGEKWIPSVELRVIPWTGWRRQAPLPEASPFFTEPPSPALQSPLAIELYPILGWYEGTGPVSVGRGTDTPFQQVGLREARTWSRPETTLYGYYLKPTAFHPAGETPTYYGWQIERRYAGPLSPDSLFRLGFWLLRTLRQAHGEGQPFFQEEFFDKLFGTPLLRWMEEKQLPIDTLYRAFLPPASWETLRQKYRLYPD